jgi:hypothetical protein
VSKNKRYPGHSRTERMLRIARRIFQVEAEIVAKRMEFERLVSEPDLQLVLPFIQEGMS